MQIAEARLQAVGSRVLVRGVVTVGPGWILGESTVAIQDDSSGIYVRLIEPDINAIVPGRVLQVEGVLADPFGNLEIRPEAADIEILDMAAIPAARQLTVADVNETSEGILAIVTGTVSSVDASSTGSVTIMVEDATGEGRIFGHAPLAMNRSDYPTGSRISAIGLVGDRLGLYRVWPRNKFDVALVPDDPTPTPSATPTPSHTPTRTPSPTPTSRPTATPTPTPTIRPTATPSPTATATTDQVIDIEAALGRQGADVSIEGAVTTRQGLLDVDGYRVTIQDSTAAILVRLPNDFSTEVGQRIRVSGEVGTYYGAPQLTAESASREGQTNVTPTQVRNGPIAASLEWRLVTITGLVQDLHRDGEAWRAEVALANGSVPVAGLERSGIDSTALVEGRQATIVGIVKRAYPTASDQRFAVVPRTAADIHLGSAAATSGPNASDPQSGEPDATSNADPDIPVWPESLAPGQSPSALDPTETLGAAGVVALSDLAGHIGQEVAIGGFVTAIDGARLTIEDETAVAVVRLYGDALSTVELISVGDLVNVRGVADRNAASGIEIGVSDASDITLLTPASAVDVTPTPSGSAAIPGASADPTAALTDASDTPTGSASAMAGLVLMASGALLAATFAASPTRRTQTRKWLEETSNSLKQRLAQFRPS